MFYSISMSQAINNHDNDIVCPEWTGLSTRKVTWWFTVTVLHFIAANWSMEATANTSIQAILIHCAAQCHTCISFHDKM